MSQKAFPILYKREVHLRELQRQSKYAPKIRTKGFNICDAESLIRVVIFPDHTHEDGSLKEEGISSDDLTKRGFSVFRDKYIENNTLTNFFDGQLQRNSTRRLICAATFSAKQIRAVSLVLKISGSPNKEEKNILAIIDDAYEKHLKSHAIIVCTGIYARSEVKEIKRLLIKLMKSNNPTLNPIKS